MWKPVNGWRVTTITKANTGEKVSSTRVSAAHVPGTMLGGKNQTLVVEGFWRAQKAGKTELAWWCPFASVNCQVTIEVLAVANPSKELMQRYSDASMSRVSGISSLPPLVPKMKNSGGSSITLHVLKDYNYFIRSTVRADASLPAPAVLMEKPAGKVLWSAVELRHIRPPGNPVVMWLMVLVGICVDVGLHCLRP